MKVALLGNCQVDPLRHLLWQSTDIREIKNFNFNLLGEKSTHESLINEISSCDLVISQVFSMDFGVFEKNQILNLFPNTVLIPNLFYLGWHPDMTYVGDNQSRIIGPTGAYHSLIALALAEFSFPQNLEEDAFNRTLEYFTSIHNKEKLSFDSLRSKFGERDLSFS